MGSFGFYILGILNYFSMFVFPESTDKLNKYLFSGGFLMEPLVIHPVMEIWMKTILAWMEVAKMDLASFMVDTRDVHQEETHLLQVCHFF